MWLITMILAVSLSNESFSSFGAKLRCSQVFRFGNGFRLFEANHAVLTLISLTATLLLFRC